MNLSVEEIRQAALPILRRYGVTKAAVFGSAVKGQLRPESDIDILVRIGEDISLLGFVGLKLDLEQALSRRVDLVEYDMIKPRLRERILEEQETIL
ncbi:MAG: nucleotidyltransferase family protein [Phycisphaerae bacterium]|jgi:predicted nucleotidyltransferase|nr:nucleotidyltransferase family protein [Phycisphaerae bacterium]